MASVSEFFQSINFFDIQDTFQEIGFYDYLFPYLIIYSLLVTVLPYVKIFQNKEGKSNKPIIVLISLIVSFFGVSFEISQGQTIGMLLMVLFPNISALTIMMLTLYIVGAILGVDVLKGLFRKDFSAHLYYSLGGIGLGMVIYFLGISFGFWSYDPLDTSSMWNVILAVAFSILAIVFAIIGNFLFAILFFVIVISWVFSSQDQSILMSFIDPVIFVFILFAFLLSWVNKGNDNPKRELAKKIEKSKLGLEKFEKNAGFTPKPFDSRGYDISHQAYLNNLKKWHDNYGDEDYSKYL